MYHPDYDPSKLTDDEIIARIAKCYRVLSSTINPQVCGSAEMILKTLEAELQERMFKQKAEQAQKDNPDGAIEIGEIKDISPKGNENE